MKKKQTEQHMFNFLLSVGKFDKAKGGIYIDSSGDSVAAKTYREEIDCPSGVTLFAFVDFPLKKDFNEEEVGELAGALSAILDALPYKSVPVPIYHSHNVDIADIEDDQKALRVKFFSSLNPEEMFGQLMQGQGIRDAPKLTDVLKGSFKMEVPFSLTDVTDPKFRFTTDKMKIKLQSCVDVDRRLESKAKQIINSLPPSLKYTMQVRLAVASFFRGVDFTFNFSDVESFFKDVAGPTVAHHGPPRGPSLLDVKEMVTEVSGSDVSGVLPSLLAPAPVLANQAGQGQLYEQARKNLLGLRTIHIQVGDTITRFRFVGLDFFPLFPPLA
jgi:hypothetical protein